MSDVFLSYARENEAQAQRVAETLRADGYGVWRDDELPAHRAYAAVIEERLKAAKAVVVLWSAEAAESQWVRAEADTAREAGTLVQASTDGTVPPLPFNQIQCADLRNWDGRDDAPGWRKLTSSVKALAGAQETPTPARRSERQLAVCVLPFANMSGDPEQEYFSDGISEDITTDLSKVSALSVTARSTAFTFKGRSVDICDVAAKLGVSHVIEGSVRKAGSRVRITAQLIDGATGDHVWAERYDRDLTDVFAIQDEISNAIVAALKVKLLPGEKKAIETRGTTDVDAYNLYLMARNIWVTGNYGDVRRDRIVARTVRNAIERDPAYGKAWALLAIAQASLRYHHHGLQGDDGLAAADRALALDSTIAEAYAVRARHFAERGEFARAEAEIDAGLRLDPDSWDTIREAARLAMMQRKVPVARDYFLRATALDETDFHSPAMLTTCFSDEGDVERVKWAADLMLKRTEKVIAQDPLNAHALGVAAGALAILGRADQAREKFNRAMLVDPDNVNMPYNFACTLAVWLKDYNGAINLLEKNFARIGPALMLTALADPDMDPLRDNPRFIAAARSAIQRLGLTAEQLPEGSRSLSD